MQSPSASYSLTVRLEITNKPGMLGQVTSAIGKAGGDIGAIDLVQVGKSTITRDLTFKARDEPHGQQDGRDREERVDPPHHDTVHQPALPPGPESQRHAHQRRRQRRAEADGERDAGAV